MHAENFLQGQLTCDVRKIREQNGLGALCNHQGRILAIIPLFKRDNDFYCFLPQALVRNLGYILTNLLFFQKYYWKMSPPNSSGMMLSVKKI